MTYRTGSAEEARSVVIIYNTARYLLNLRSDLIRVLFSEGARVSAIVPRGEGVDELRALGVVVYEWNVSEHGTNPLMEWKSFRHLKCLVKEARGDIVFNFTVKPVVYGSLAAGRARRCRIFSMITGRGYLFGGDSLKQRVMRRAVLPLYSRALRYNARVFFQNSEDMDFFVRRRLVTADQSVIIDGSGVDVEKFAPRPEEAVPGTFLLAARLLKEKGIVEYVAAARRLKAVYPDARFQLLGPFVTAPTGIRDETMREWESEGIIEYLGETSDVRPYLASSFVFVLPSYYGEGLPRVSLEALAMGKPIITTDWPGCREVVGRGPNGVLVPVRDSAALAEAMELFLKNPGLAAEMGRKSRMLAERRFDVRRVNATIVKHLLQ